MEKLSWYLLFEECINRSLWIILMGDITVSYLFWTAGIWQRTRFKHIQASKRFWQPWKGIPSCRKAFYTQLKLREGLLSFLANKLLHLIRKILGISGHINHAHHVQLGSQEVLVANGLTRKTHPGVLSNKSVNHGKFIKMRVHLFLFWTWGSWSCLPSLKLDIAPENRPKPQKEKIKFPTIHFPGVLPRNLTWNLKMIVSKRSFLF